MNHIHHKELTQQDVDLYFYYRQHGIHKAFFNRYFAALPKSRTNVEAFNQANDEYYMLFSDYKYASYDSFRTNLKRYFSNENN